MRVSAHKLTVVRALPLLQVLALPLGLVAVGCDENILDPMADRQQKSIRYKESPFYADGLSMRAAPEGTVPRERITLNPRLTTGREPDGPMQPNMEPLPNYVTTVPLPMSRKLLDLGRKRFNITCATCHGPLADGKSIVATQMSLRPPPSLQDPKFVAKPAGYIYEVISKGFGLMASYAAELSVEERWSVVAYLRALQLSQNTPVGALPPEIRQQLEALPANMDAPAPPAPPAPVQGQGEEEKR
jgi:mono/diheme cytochrome c family protein